MKVLLIAPQFYGYHKLIRKEIERMGYRCDEYLYPDGFFFNLFSITPILKRWSNLIKDFHLRNSINKNRESYDIVLIIKGSEISLKNHLLLRQLFPDAKFSLYIWDDIELDRGEIDVMKFYDRVFSYNPNDCKKYNMVFRPMFFDQSILLDYSTPKDIDLFYIASYRPNRLCFINRIFNNTQIYNLVYKIILRCSLFSFIRHIENIKHIKYFNFLKVPYRDMVQYLSRSKCSIELCRPGQESLSTRSFEALYTKTKIITTNASIKSYDFYNPVNVLVVDEENPIIPLEWVNLPFQDIDKELLKKYTLQTFVQELITL